ncbi:MAG: ABC-2 family transporter protein, partial [Acetatifactor sp.]|nr:ABC-2 family transporter protein [Acetatifactor sp.]
ADVLFQMFFTIGRIMFAYLLWKVIFNGRESISGFTFDSMLSYYIFNSFLTQLDLSRGISEEIHNRIRGGSFSKYIVLPISTEGYFLAMEAGVVLFYLVFDLIAAFAWVLIFGIRLQVTGEVQIILCALLMTLLGLLFMVQLNYYLGLLTLKYRGIGTFLMIKNNLAALITGSIVPLALLPEGVVQLMRLLPFYYVTYLPSMLMTGRCREEALTGLAVLAVWCLVMQAAIYLTWEKYSRKYDGVGI